MTPLEATKIIELYQRTLGFETYLEAWVDLERAAITKSVEDLPWAFSYALVCLKGVWSHELVHEWPLE